VRDGGKERSMKDQQGTKGITGARDDHTNRIFVERREKRLTGEKERRRVIRNEGEDTTVRKGGGVNTGAFNGGQGGGGRVVEGKKNYGVSPWEETNKKRKIRQART